MLPMNYDELNKEKKRDLSTLWGIMIFLALFIGLPLAISYFSGSSSNRNVSNQTQSDCDPNYTPCVPNTSYDLNCADVGHQVTVVGTDDDHLDGDGDGIGCESY